MARAARDLESLRTAIQEERPEAVLTDIRMPPTNTDEGIQVARELRRRTLRLGWSCSASLRTPSTFWRCWSPAPLAGDTCSRSGFARRRSGGAIEAVVRGGSFVDPKIVDVLVGARRLEATSAISELTRRELSVLALLARGQSNAAIAESLSITKRAVEKHINSIFMKLGLAGAESISHRVKAALVYLAENHDRDLG